MKEAKQINASTDKVKDILDILNWENLPKSVQPYFGRLRGKFSFFDDLYNFQRALEALSTTSAKEKYYGNLFLGLAYYYLKDEKRVNASKATSCIQKAILETKNEIRDPEEQNLILRMLISVKHRLTKLDKILFLIDSKYDNEVSFESVRRYYKRYVTPVWVSSFDESKFELALRTYDQIFVFAHGDDSGTLLGKQEITASWLIPKLKQDELSLRVLGLFSCQENFSESDVRNNVDYFITDTDMSNPHINELFCYGYIQNYLKSYRVIESFEIGRLAPIFRASSDPGIQIYEGGGLVNL